MLKDETVPAPETKRPESQRSQKRERSCEERYERHGRMGDRCARSEHCFTQSDNQEQATSFQHMIGVERNVLRVKPPSGYGMCEPCPDEFHTTSYYPP